MRRRKHLEETSAILPQWKDPDVSKLAPERRQRYEANCKALRAYLGAARVDTIETQHGISRQQLSRLLDRALTVDRAGKSYGFRACIPNLRVKEAARKAPLRQEHILRGKGLACLMQSVVASSPRLQSFVHDLLPVLGRRLSHKRYSRIFSKFKALASEHIQPDEYPFYLVDEGRDAFRRYLRRKAKEYAQDAIRTLSVTPVRASPGDGTGMPSLSLTRNIYDEVEFDGWLEPVDLEILIPSFSDDYVPRRITGIGLLAIIERKTRCVIGKFPLFSTSYDLTEFLLCVNNALEKWMPRELEIPVFQYAPGGGLPSGLHPDANGRMWDILFGDNARVHISAVAQRALLDKAFCHINFGRAGEPTARPIVERFFEHMNQLWIKKLLPKRSGKPGKTKVAIKPEYAIPMAWIEDLFDILVVEYNVTPHTTLQNQAPLTVMLHALDREAGWGRTDPSDTAAWRKITHIQVEKRLHRPKGRSPYAIYENGTYTSDLLRFADFSMEEDPIIVLDVDLLDLQGGFNSEVQRV
ncbi:hypothetical protein [Rhodanobacter thiooxydans]|nr:hypothetical protein [Rhodanobacter thiooxydans]